jgi:RNA-binding protein
VSYLDKKRIIELKGKAQALKPTVHVGKEGATEDLVSELIKQLKKNKLVKAKLLPSVEEDRKRLGEALAAKTGSTLIEVRGRTVVLARE